MSRGGVGVEGLLWGVAYAALGFQAVFTPADLRSAAALCGLGAGLWGLALVLEGRGESAWLDRRGNGTLGLTLVAFGLPEAAGLAAAVLGGSGELACWFGVAVAAAAAGGATARVRRPDDGQFLAQLAFHLPLAAPAMAVPVALAVSSRAEGVGLAMAAVALARPWVVVFCVVLPVTLALEGFVLAYWIAARQGREQAAWSALVAFQAAWSVFLIRWASDGF